MYFYSDNGYKYVKFFSFSESSFEALPIILFSFTCQVNAFEIQSELKHPTSTEMRKVNTVSLFLCFTTYIILIIVLLLLDYLVIMHFQLILMVIYYFK